MLKVCIHISCQEDHGSLDSDEGLTSVAEEAEEESDHLNSPTLELPGNDEVEDTDVAKPGPVSLKKDGANDLRGAYWNFIHSQQKILKKKYPDLSAKEILSKAREMQLYCKHMSKSIRIWFTTAVLCWPMTFKHCLMSLCCFYPSLFPWESLHLMLRSKSSPHESDPKRQSQYFHAIFYSITLCHSCHKLTIFIGYPRWQTCDTRMASVSKLSKSERSRRRIKWFWFWGSTWHRLNQRHSKTDTGHKTIYSRTVCLIWSSRVQIIDNQSVFLTLSTWKIQFSFDEDVWCGHLPISS